MESLKYNIRGSGEMEDSHWLNVFFSSTWTSATSTNMKATLLPNLRRNGF